MHRLSSAIMQSLLPIGVIGGALMFFYGLFSNQFGTALAGLVVAFGVIGTSHP